MKTRPGWILLGGLAIGQALSAEARADGFGGLGDVRNPFNNKPIGEQIGDGRGGIKILPGRPAGDQGSQIAVISEPSIDPDTGVVYGGTTSGGGHGNRVGSATLYKAQDGRWWWRSDYRNTYTGSPRPVPASERIQRVKQDQDLAARREQEQRERAREQERVRQQRERDRQLALQRQQERDRQLALQRQQFEEGRRLSFNLEQARAEQSRRQEAWEMQRRRGVREAEERGLAQERIRMQQEFQDRQRQEPVDRRPGTAPLTRVAGEIFAPNLGIFYQQVAYADGTFGARLTRDASPDTPAGTLGLEVGDTIFALDGMRFRTPDDVLAHRQQTTIEFVNVRTNGKQAGSFYIP